MLVALLELLEDPRGRQSILGPAADMPQDPSVNLSIVGPAADLRAPTGIQILRGALTLEMVASREVQCCGMVWRVLKQCLDHFGAKQTLLTDSFDVPLASQPALAMRLGVAVLRARIVERFEGSNSTHHDVFQAFSVFLSTVLMEESTRHLSSTDQPPSTEQPRSATAAPGRATACVINESIDVRSIRHMPGVPGWEGPEQSEMCVTSMRIRRGVL
jgi:hypothetical protein